VGLLSTASIVLFRKPPSPVAPLPGVLPLELLEGPDDRDPRESIPLEDFPDLSRDESPEPTRRGVRLAFFMAL